jgi:hypothetical protein
VWKTTDRGYFATLLVLEVVTFEVMEAWRFYGFSVFRYGYLKYGVLLVPPSLALPFLLAMLPQRSNRYVNALLLFVYAISLSAAIQIGFGEHSIISSVWYLVIGLSWAGTYYLDRLAHLTELLGDIVQAGGYEESIGKALDLLSQQSKFYLDRWTVAVTALGGATGTMMTILWQDPFQATGGLRTQKLMDAVYISIAFFSVLLTTARMIALPAYSVFRQCPRASYTLGADDE